MKRKVSLILIIVLMFGVSIQSYALNEPQHIYYKFTLKTWWDKNNNGGTYDKKAIYSNELVRDTFGEGSSQTVYVDAERISGYTNYQITSININGYTSHEINGISSKTLNIGNERFLTGGKTGYTKQLFTHKYRYLPDVFSNRWAFEFLQLESWVLKLDYNIYEHKDKDIFLNNTIATKGTYPSNGLHTDGYWYVDMGVLNKNPEFSIIQPIINQRTGSQDVLFINGIIKDEDVGDVLNIKYSLKDIIGSNVTLTQPKNLISNGQEQSFQGAINLTGLSSGENILKLWAEDDKGAKSNILDAPIIVFNTLENVLSSLRAYIYKAGEPQILVINSNTIITQSEDNDILIAQIKRELEIKNVKLFFIGKNETTENYIKSKLLSN